MNPKSEKFARNDPNFVQKKFFFHFNLEKILPSECKDGCVKNGDGSILQQHSKQNQNF